MTTDIKQAIEIEIERIVPESTDALHAITVEYASPNNKRVVRIFNQQRKAFNARNLLQKLRSLPDSLGHDKFWGSIKDVI